MNPPTIPEDVQAYHAKQTESDAAICKCLAHLLLAHLPEAKVKIWHAHPVWFIHDNPIAGYSKLKHCVRLLFWSGQSFDEPGLSPEGSFKAAEVRFTHLDELNEREIQAWIEKAKVIQWDYKNLIKRKGKLELISNIGGLSMAFLLFNF